jgi:hypothetical protein
MVSYTTRIIVSQELHNDATLGFGRDLAASREIPGVFSLMNFDSSRRLMVGGRPKR